MCGAPILNLATLAARIEKERSTMAKPPPAETTRQIPFTETEANALMSLLDLAVKAGGLQIAPTAITLAQKVQEAFAAKEEEQS